MTKSLPRGAKHGQANRIASRSQKSDGLSPLIADEIGQALALCQGTQKAEAVAWRFNWDRATYYRRLHDPMGMTVDDLLRLVVLCPDPKFGSRLRGHLAVLDSHQALAEREAGETYVRVTGQGRLFGGGR